MATGEDESFIMCYVFRITYKGHISKWKFSHLELPLKITPCSWVCSEQLYTFSQFKLADLLESHLLN